MGEQLLVFYYKRIKENHKIAFCAAFIIGLLIHIYKFTNFLPNHDSLYNFYSSQNMLGSGRWFLSIACGFSSYCDLPWINGLFSITFIALTVVVIVEIFKVNNKVLIILMAGTIAAFPSITQTFSYEFTADGYMLAMLLATVSVKVMPVRKKTNILNMVLAAGLLSLVCGIYQAYVSFSLVLAILYFMTELLENRNDFKTYLAWLRDECIIYIGGAVLYYVIWQVCMKLKGCTPSSYQGIDEIGHMSFADILSTAQEVIKEFIAFFIRQNKIGTVFNICFVITAASVVIFVVFRSGLYCRLKELLLFIISSLMIPFSVYICCFASTKVSYGVRMLTSISLLYVIILIWLERWCHVFWKDIGALLMAGMIFNNAIMANVYYLYMNQCYEKSYATAVEVSTRIHMLDYGSAKEVTIIGRLNTYRNQNNIVPASWYKVPSMGYIDNNLMDRQWYIALFLSNMLGFELSYYNENIESVPTIAMKENAPVPNDTTFKFPLLTDEEKMKEIVDSEKFISMGCWPASDSVSLIGDTIVVKLSEVKN